MPSITHRLHSFLVRKQFFRFGKLAYFTISLKHGRNCIGRDFCIELMCICTIGLPGPVRNSSRPRNILKREKNYQQQERAE